MNQDAIIETARQRDSETARQRDSETARLIVYISIN